MRLSEGFDFFRSILREGCGFIFFSFFCIEESRRVVLRSRKVRKEKG